MFIRLGLHHPKIFPGEQSTRKRTCELCGALYMLVPFEFVLMVVDAYCGVVFMLTLLVFELSGQLIVQKKIVCRDVSIAQWRWVSAARRPTGVQETISMPSIKFTGGTPCGDDLIAMHKLCFRKHAQNASYSVESLLHVTQWLPKNFRGLPILVKC